jgi:hypothetical protein
MTYRAILLSLAPGESHTFDTIDSAKSASSSACKLYGVDRKFKRSGATITRIE